jgi:hypothetical protein
MKRHLLIIACFLLLGAVVNVGVAWGCAAGSGWVLGGTSAGASESQWWDQRAPAGFGGQFDGGFYTPSLGALNTQFFGGVPETEKGVMPYAALRIRSGIPALGLEGSFWYDKDRALVYADPPLAPQPWLNEARPFPFRPIWPGFVINTLFYADILWLLIPGPFALRRFLRLKRGLCLKCAYPMGESSVCSECGRDLPKRVRAT